MLNVLPFDTIDGRERGGKRGGTLLRFRGPLGGGSRVQAMCSLIKPQTESGVRRGDCEDALTEFQGSSGAAVNGNVWLLNSKFRLIRARLDPDEAVHGFSPERCKWHPGGEKFAYVIEYVNGSGRRAVKVVCVDTEGVVAWTTNITSASKSYASNAVAANSTFFVVTGGDSVHLLRWDTGSLIATDTISGWAQTVNSATIRNDGKLVVGFKGTGFSAPLAGGQVIQNGRHFRSGLALYSLSTSAPGLSREQFGTPLPSNHPFYETNHGYFRIAEQSIVAPFGGIPYSLAAAPDGGVVCVRHNFGWGPNNTFYPTAAFPAISIFKVSEAGALEWELDVNTLKRDYPPAPHVEWWVSIVGRLKNDVPYEPEGGRYDEPTLRAVACNSDGRIVVAGQSNDEGSLAAGTNVWCLDSTGTILWQALLENYVAKHSVRWDQADDSVVLAGTQAASGVGGADAILWRLNGETGALIDSFDLSASNKHGRGVDVSPQGLVVLTSIQRV